jgi:hypothetical protein
VLTQKENKQRESKPQTPIQSTRADESGTASCPVRLSREADLPPVALASRYARTAAPAFAAYRDGLRSAGTAPGNLSRRLLIVVALESKSFAHFACPKPEEVGLRKAKFFWLETIPY